ncbi:AraC family transcriptional regulator [Actinoplanes bogorensis]|uniref:AraC family transcriptional regulator n=1 Tax=Paractinoplanes bogorensis TaxID=1610840 RepID=A0ABS5YZS2_9ACTN|nr:AraC family transcriptional regulator [Actinoplanes bogorensis]MBU2668950.1 AraC family transcriptional regulator [Actinoplanes bogorensis]
MKPDRPVRTELRTRDQDVAVDAIMRIADHRPRITITDRPSVGFSVRSAHLADWGTDVVAAHGVRYGSTMTPRPQLIAGVWLHGHGMFQGGSQEHTQGPGDGFLYPLGTTLVFDNVEPAKSLVRLPFAGLAGLAEEITGLAPVDLRFLSWVPRNQALNDSWAATVAFLVDHLNDPDRDIPPVLAEQLLRLAMAALLRAFPNTTMTASRMPVAGSAGPAVVRRATAFIEAEAGRPLTVSEIAAASGVDSRTLQEAFRRYADTTPSGYLRRVRLQQARAQLRAARPGDGTTVAGVARRWGFVRPRRFATAYREAFGEPPRTGP